MKRRITLFTTMFCLSISYFLNAQNVGINTNSPQVPLHVEHEDGLTNVDLLMLGENPGTHLLQGVNRIQAWRSSTPAGLLLQPDGADLTVGDHIIYVDAANKYVGINSQNPDTDLKINGEMRLVTGGFTTTQKDKIAINGLLESQGMLGLGWTKFSTVGTGSGPQASRMADTYEMYYRSQGAHRWFINQTPDVDNPQMILDDNGRLGLGIDEPLSSIHAVASEDQFLKLNTTTFSGTSQAGIDLLRSSQFNSTDWRIVNDGGVLKFNDGTNNFVSGAGVENMRISPGGFVGIGMSDPQTRLHVNGGAFASMTGAGDMQIGSPTGTRLVFDDNEILARNGENPTTLYLQYWGGGLNLANTEDGEVGIGTSPVNDAKVTIQDNGWQLQFENNDTGINDWFMGASDDGWSAGGDKLVISPNTGSGNAVISMDAGGDVLLIPLEQGQVGIGVSAIANLPTGYLLAVDGKIISEEVRVELSGSWPDYVFEEDYALTPLDELENEIASLGHLPGIPSADIIENEGFELGDMQTRMMEKIEELTLYMIQMNKENKSLRTEVEELKSLVKK